MATVTTDVAEEDIAEIRCENTMHGVIYFDDSTIEIKCRNSRCGAKSGVVVIHIFDQLTGEMLATDRYQDPIGRGGDR